MKYKEGKLSFTLQIPHWVSRWFVRDEDISRTQAWGSSSREWRLLRGIVSVQQKLEKSDG